MIGCKLRLQPFLCFFCYSANYVQKFCIFALSPITLKKDCAAAKQTQSFFYVCRKITIFADMKIREFFKEHTIGGVSFVIFATLSVVLLALSFILPPTGTIDPSVLTAVGELFAFASLGVLITAIGKGKRATVRHNDTELTIEEQQKTEDDGEL